MRKWTATDIPQQNGRTAVITGANTGLGYETAAVLAAKGARVVLAVRNVEKGTDALRRIQQSIPGARVELQILDLSSLESVRAAARSLAANHDSIDLLINNAGVVLTPRSSTRDGFDMQFGTNHLGHFAFTGLLLDCVLAAPKSRIITVGSLGHRLARGIRFDDPQWQRKYSRLGAYGQSKLANLMFTYELQRRLQSTPTIAVAAHPGGSNTEFSRNSPTPVRQIFTMMGPLLAQEAAMGALPTLRAATDPGVLGGQYYGPDGLGGHRGHPRVIASSKASYDVDAQQRLWAMSEELTGVVYPAKIVDDPPRSA
jgi:NAD(P)-dependent dehydrogenase (short-subunit alcohol dehydrogenase family)